jgi:hypothetical protein
MHAPGSSRGIETTARSATVAAPTKPTGMSTGVQQIAVAASAGFETTRSSTNVPSRVARALTRRRRPSRLRLLASSPARGQAHTAAASVPAERRSGRQKRNPIAMITVAIARKGEKTTALPATAAMRKGEDEILDVVAGTSARAACQSSVIAYKYVDGIRPPRLHRSSFRRLSVFPPR